MVPPFGSRLKRLVLAASLLLLRLATPATADPAIWVVKDADSTVYLLGTIHALPANVQWHSDKLDGAFKQSSEYWMEADIQEDPAIAQTFAMNFGMDSKHPLASKLDPKDYALFLKLVAARGVPPDRVAFIRPWLATLLLTNDAFAGNGYDPKNGVDRVLETAAKQAGKPVKFFETSSKQLGFFADLPPEIERGMLVDTLHDLARSAAEPNPKATGPGQQIDALESAWLAGDTKRLYDVGFKGMITRSPEVFHVIITQRNASWIPEIEALMKKPGTYFIAVGAGHLIGAGGLPALLAKDGFKVARY
jgi:hypothetical protein